MTQVEVRRLAAVEPARIRQPRRFVQRSVARDGAGGLHRAPDGLGRKVRRARIAAALAEVHRDRERLVAVVLDGFVFPEANGHGLAHGSGSLGLGVARAACAGELQRAQGGRLERGAVEGKRRGGGGIGHGFRGQSRARFARTAAKTSKILRARQRACTGH